MNCRRCGRELTDPASRAFRIGPECRRGMTPRQLQDALKQALAESDPGYIPPERPPTVQAQLNNAAARRAAAAPAPATLCDHGGVEGACPRCRRENDPTLAAARIIAEIRAERTHARALGPGRR